MNEKADKTDERVEHLLRRWGDDEAASRTETGPPPQVVIHPRGGEVQHPSSSRVLRWGPLAAAALLLIAAGVLFVASRTTDDQEQSQQLTAKIGELESALTDARTALEKSQAAMGAAEAELAGGKRDAQALEIQLAELRTALSSQGTALETSEARRGELEAKLLAGQSALAAARDELKRTESDRAAAVKRRGEVEVELKRTGERMTALAGETDRLRKMNDETVARANEARSELAMLKARHAVILLDVQKAYLATRSSEMGVKGRQEAGRRARMIERYSELRLSSGDAATGRLLDRLEVMLTRLDLLDAYDVDATETFAEMFARSGIEAEIDKTLGGGLVGPAVRMWLFEAKLILSGASRAS